MSREQNNVVYIESGFINSKQLISSKLNSFDVVELRAKDKFIDLAIQLAEHFVMKEGTATYEKFNSSLTKNSDDQPIPQISIKLAYYAQPKPKERNEQAVQRKQYRQRQQGDRFQKDEQSHYDGDRRRNEREKRRFRD